MVRRTKRSRSAGINPTAWRASPLVRITSVRCPRPVGVCALDGSATAPIGSRNPLSWTSLTTPTTVKPPAMSIRGMHTGSVAER